MPLFVISGYSGSGKTIIIRLLKGKEFQVIDLEELSAHNGSVFGHLASCKQPSAFQFNKMLLKQWNSFDLKRPIIVENKPRSLGKLNIPEWFTNLMRQAPLISLQTEKIIRVQNVYNTYKNIDSLKFKEALQKLSSKLDKLTLYEALRFYENGNLTNVIEILLPYYDSGVYYNVEAGRIVHTIEINKWNTEEILKKVIIAISVQTN
jgi:tRNA 2-selenouridine synthase